jgi:hypothetical protein
MCTNIIILEFISNNEYIKISDIIIKMDNYEHQIEHFSVAVDSIYKKLSRPINTINHPPFPAQYEKWG